MCIRSKDGVITAWFAISESSENNPIQSFKKNLYENLFHWPDCSASNLKQRKELSSLPIYIHRCIAFCLLLAIHNSAILPEVSSALIINPNMVPKIVNMTNPLPLITLSSNAPYRRISKRSIPKRPERHLWSPDLVTFVCDKLTDPCTRASFLRRHVYFEVCPDLPPLYLLPHIETVTESSNDSVTASCDSTDESIRNTDGLYRAYLETSPTCRKSLDALDAKIHSSLNQDLDMFADILERSFCNLPVNISNSMTEECSLCQKAYWSWVCSTTFPIFYPVVSLPVLSERGPLPNTLSTTSANPSSITTPITSRNRSYSPYPLPPPRLKEETTATPTFRLGRLEACMTWCTEVETVCPYYNPADFTSNGGEPTFLCDESHYQSVPRVNPHLTSQYTGCEYGCCFTFHDLLLDAISDKSPSNACPSALSDPMVTNILGLTVKEQLITEEYFSLPARCLHQQLSDRLGNPVLTYHSRMPHRSDLRPSSSNSVAETAAFCFPFLAVATAIVNLY